MRLYFAGGESWSNLLLDMGVKYQLMSYFYFREQLRNEGLRARQLLSRMRRAQTKGYSFILDSGAFTYHERQRRKQRVPEPQAYWDEYFNFVMDYGDLFDIIAEFDVDGSAKNPDGTTVSTKQVDEWTNEFLQIPDLRKRTLPVYHPHRGVNWLDSYLKDTSCPLLGYGSDGGGGRAGAVVAKTHRWGKWIHGFAQTSIKTHLKYSPFDSVDSTTWLRADKYGGTCILQDGKWIVLDHEHKADRRKYKRYFESWGLDFKKILQDDLHELRKSTIIAWRELASSFERKGHIRSGGRSPYLCEMHQLGVVPDKHPNLMTSEERANLLQSMDAKRMDQG